MQFDILFPLIFLGVVAAFVWRLFRHGTLTGALLGGRVEHEVGEIELQKGLGGSQVLRVSSMKSPDGEKFVGIALVSKAALGASMVPVRLSHSQAAELARLLESARLH